MAGRYDEAEQALMKAKEAKPNDPLVYTTLSGFYNRQGDFDKTIEALQKAAELEPRIRPAISCWRPTIGRRPTRTTGLRHLRRRSTSKRGLEATDKALALNADYADALTYKNLLLRMQGNEEDRSGKTRRALQAGRRTAREGHRAQ
jgi:tetratricopeptide (TPR) repeat protein